MKKPYGKECDFWSIGVVTFILLSGTPPFYEEDNFAMFEQIKACKYDFAAETWQNVSKEAKDFIAGILVADPTKRLSTAQMMDHPWMKIELLEDNVLNVAKSLGGYVAARKELSKKSLLENEDMAADMNEDDDMDEHY